jgi:uncharacterized surface protein with fasciclin (FAS1) repeats
MKSRLLPTLFFLLFSLFAFSQTVVDVIVNSDDHTTLEAAVIAAELDGPLSGDGPFTVFAPTDDAFDLLPMGTVTNLLADPTGDLARILLYHVLGAEVMSASLTDGQIATTLLGQNIDVSITTDGVFINGAEVSVTDIPASNGVVHVLDAVILPPAATVVDVVVNSAVHNTLETAVIAAELDDDLSGDGPFTLFAPTDAAFAMIDPDVLNALLADPTGDLASILLYHTVSGEVLSSDLMNGMIAPTLEGSDIEVTINTDGVFINDAEVIISDIRTFNGVVHVLDAVLLPPVPSVVDIIVESDVHTTLETAVIAAGLDGPLSGDGPFTVFAPTDDAFALIDPDALNALLADPTGDLARILLYHVLGAEVLSTDLTDGQVATTLLGQNIEVSITANDVFINGAQVIVTDIPASNGVVHVLDAVILPPAATVVDVVVNSAVHNTLETAVIAAELDDDLSGDGPFTLFAPTDAAFAMIDPDVLNTLLADPTGDLANILLYHVIPSEVLSGDLMDGMIATTLFDNQDVTVSINTDGVFINDAEVIIADIRTYNGVVHVIDAVLTPTLTSAVKNLTEMNIKAYPNPVENSLNIELPTEMADQNVTIDLVDGMGKTIKSWAVNGNNLLADLSEIPTGFYFLSLTSDSYFAKMKVVKK